MPNGSSDSLVIVQTGDAAPANAGVLIMALRTPGTPVPMAGTGPLARMTETFEGLCRSASERIGVAATAFGDVLKNGPIEGVELNSDSPSQPRAGL